MSHYGAGRGSNLNQNTNMRQAQGQIGLQGPSQGYGNQDRQQPMQQQPLNTAGYSRPAIAESSKQSSYGSITPTISSSTNQTQYQGVPYQQRSQASGQSGQGFPQTQNIHNASPVIIPNALEQANKLFSNTHSSTPSTASLQSYQNVNHVGPAGGQGYRGPVPSSVPYNPTEQPQKSTQGVNRYGNLNSGPSGQQTPGQGYLPSQDGPNRSGYQPAAGVDRNPYSTGNPGPRNDNYPYDSRDPRDSTVQQSNPQFRQTSPGYQGAGLAQGSPGYIGPGHAQASTGYQGSGHVQGSPSAAAADSFRPATQAGPYNQGPVVNNTHQQYSAQNTSQQTRFNQPAAKHTGGDLATPVNPNAPNRYTGPPQQVDSRNSFEQQQQPAHVRDPRYAGRGAVPYGQQQASSQGYSNLNQLQNDSAQFVVDINDYNRHSDPSSGQAAGVGRGQGNIPASSQPHYTSSGVGVGGGTLPGRPVSAGMQFENREDVDRLGPGGGRYGQGSVIHADVAAVGYRPHINEGPLQGVIPVGQGGYSGNKQVQLNHGMNPQPGLNQQQQMAPSQQFTNVSQVANHGVPVGQYDHNPNQVHYESHYQGRNASGPASDNLAGGRLLHAADGVPHAAQIQVDTGPTSGRGGIPYRVAQPGGNQGQELPSQLDSGAPSYARGAPVNSNQYTQNQTTQQSSAFFSRQVGASQYGVHGPPAAVNTNVQPQAYVQQPSTGNVSNKQGPGYYSQKGAAPNVTSGKRAFTNSVQTGNPPNASKYLKTSHSLTETVGNAGSKGLMRTSFDRPVVKSNVTMNVGRDRDATAVTRRSPSIERGRASKRGSAGQSNRRSRSRSPSPVRDRRRAAPSSRSGASHGDSNLSTSASIHRKIELSKLSYSSMVEHYNVATVSRHSQSLSVRDVLMRFPKMYVPADFVRIEVDWEAIMQELHSGLFRKLHLSASVEITNQPSTVQNAQWTNEYPKGTHVDPSDNIQLGCCNRISFNPPKSIKFNARVLITMGMTNSETERIDYSLPKKLRTLIGRRKANFMLLGGSWNEELDGGNPLYDRRCLYNTARRMVLAQAMLDISHSTRYLKLCEIFYQRPKEEIRGKTYPEQDEVTTVFLCSLLPALEVSEEEFSVYWQNYCLRKSGSHPGPSAAMSVPESLSLLFSPPDGGDVISTNEAQTSEQSIVCAADDLLTPDVTISHDDIIQASSDSMNIETTELAIEANPISSSNSCIEFKGDENQAAVEALAADKCLNPKLVIDGKDTKSEVVEPTKASDPQPPGSVSHLVGTEGKGSDNSVVTSQNLSSIPSKPTLPTFLACPLPLTIEQASNPDRKNETVSLRSTTLGQLLAYTEDDSNERVFEASITAEIVRSIMAIDNADIVADFIMADYAAESNFSDPRALTAVKTLRGLTRLLTNQSKKEAEAVSAHVTTETVSTVSISDSNITADNNAQTEQPKSEKASEDSVGESHSQSKTPTEPQVDKIDDADSMAVESVDPSQIDVLENKIEGEASITESIEFQQVIDAIESQPVEVSVQHDMPGKFSDTIDITNIESESGAAGGDAEEKLSIAEAEAEGGSEMSEVEAREWRRAFVNSCRWFDVDQQRYLRQDHLELLLQCSSRDLSRAEISAAAAHVCKDDKLRYEMFI